MPSEKANAIFSSSPMVPAFRPRPFRPLPSATKGLSSSCQVRTSASCRMVRLRTVHARGPPRRRDRPGTAWSFRGDHQCPKAFAAIEAQVGEVDGRGGGVGEHDGVDFCCGHEVPRALDAGQALGVGEGPRLAGEIGKRRDGGRGGWRCLPSLRWKCGGSDSGGGGTEKIATSERGKAGQGNGPPGNLRRGLSRVMVEVSFQL